MVYNRKDKYYKKAKEEGYVSRAAYKILDIQKRFRLFKKGQRILDLGCAPGGWLQVMLDFVGPQGQVIGTDLEEVTIHKRPYLTLLQGDMLDPAFREVMQKEIGTGCDMVVSDMAPHLSGIKFRDQQQSFELSSLAFDVASENLKEGGHFIVKTFPCGDVDQWIIGVRRRFQSFKHFVPESTRKTSNEVYLIGMGFKKDAPKK